MTLAAVLAIGRTPRTAFDIGWDPTGKSIDANKLEDLHAVVHTHSTYAAAVSCLDGLDPANALPPLTAYYAMRVGTLPLLPYCAPELNAG